jgi:hypothetical protein
MDEYQSDGRGEEGDEGGKGLEKFILAETLVAADRAAELTATSFIRLLDAHRLERALEVNFPLAKKLYHRERAQYGFYLADFPRDDDAYVEWQTKLGDIFCTWLVKMWDRLQEKLLEWVCKLFFFSISNKIRLTLSYCVCGYADEWMDCGGCSSHWLR